MGEGGTITHPSYVQGDPREPKPLYYVHLGDEVALATDPMLPVGVVTAIYLDGLLELSTGDDDVLPADLVLLRRAES